MTVPAEKRIRNAHLTVIRTALNMSQAEFAKAIRDAGTALGEPNTCNKRLVQKWESGEHAACRQNYRRALEYTTNRPFAELGFSHSMYGASRHALGADIHGPVDLASTIAPGDDVSAPLRHALSIPELATAETVDLAADRAGYLFALETHTPARLVMPMVERHIREIAALLTGTRHKPFRRKLAIAGGQSAALAGWLAFDLRKTDAAHRYWETAMACARDASDAPLSACVLTYQSYAAAERGDPEAAWQLAQAAVNYAGNNPRARAWAAVRAAQEAAQLGDTTASLAALAIALDRARQLGRTNATDDAEPWCRFVDSAYLYAMAANAYGWLGDAKSAHASAVRALDCLNSSPTKIRALVLTEAAHALAACGDTTRATQLAAEAATLTDKLDLPHVKLGHVTESPRLPLLKIS